MTSGQRIAVGRSHQAHRASGQRRRAILARRAGAGIAAGSLTAFVLSLAVHGGVLGMVIWEPSPDPYEPTEVEAIEVDLVPPGAFTLALEGPPTHVTETSKAARQQSGEEETIAAETAGAPEAAEAEASAAPDPTRTTAATADTQAAEAEADTQASEAEADTQASEAEAEAQAAEAEAEAPAAPDPAQVDTAQPDDAAPQDPAELSAEAAAPQSTPEQTEPEDTAPPAQEDDPPTAPQSEETPPQPSEAARNEPPAPARADPSGILEDGAPISPVYLNLGAPDALTGGIGEAGLPQEGAETEEPAEAPQQAAAPEADEPPAPPGDAEEPVETAAASPQVLATDGPADWSVPAPSESDGEAPVDPQDEAQEEPAAAPEEPALEDGTALRREIALPRENPRRDSETAALDAAEEAVRAIDPAQLSAAAMLQAALSAARSENRADERGAGESATVAYTEAVRSAIAPIFWNEMRNIPAIGTVVVEVVIRRDGTVNASRIIRGSGDAALDRASLYAASVAPYPALPSDITSETLSVHIPLRAR